MKNINKLAIILLVTFALLIVGCTKTTTYSTNFTDRTGNIVTVNTTSTSAAICTQDYEPICGTNNVTYTNRCTIEKANQQVAYTGECNSPNYSGNTSKVCPTNYAPVCGSDDKTYTNSCVARNANVVLIHDGTCRNEFPVTMIITNDNFTINKNTTVNKEVALTIINQKNMTVRVDIARMNVYTTLAPYETVTVSFTPNATGYYAVDVNGQQASTLRVI